MDTTNKIGFTTYDVVTGEVLEERKLNKNEQLKVVRKITPKQREHHKNKWDMQAMTRSLDGFVWVFYFNNELLFSKEVVSKANITRLMMLATYMNYKNQLVTSDELLSEKVIRLNNDATYMNKKDIQQVLNLKDGTFKQFFKEVTNANILIEEDGKFLLSQQYFYKGEINSHREKIWSSYTRMYVKPIRQIYNSMKATKHNLLSYVFQLIPCVHYSTNFICKNLDSSNEVLDYMNIKDICEFLGLATDKKSMAKFKKDLKSIHVEHNGRMAHLVNEVIYSSSTNYKQRFVFNPYVVTSISQKDEINNIMKSLFVE